MSSDWRQYFGQSLISGNADEIAAAASAAERAERAGAGPEAARTAGKDAARRYRESAGAGRARTVTADPSPDAPWVTATPAQGGELTPWASQLANRLFATPGRWGWQPAVAPATEAAAAPTPAPRPVWSEPPRPDASALRARRTQAVTRLLVRIALTVVAVSAFLTYQLTIEGKVDEFGANAHQVYRVVLLVLAAAFAVSVARALVGLRGAAVELRRFEQPYQQMRDDERARHQEALRRWESEQRKHSDAAAATARAARDRASGPQWYPVHPASEPTRVDVLGGDPRRHGWASLLVTLGASVLSAGHRITLLDLTGQDVGGGLLEVARAGGRSVRAVELVEDDSPDDGAPRAPQVDLLGWLAPASAADCLADALTDRPEGDHREERALAADVLRRVLDVLDGPPRFARLAAGVRALRRGDVADLLSPSELRRLTEQIGDVDQDDWSSRQLRLLASQLDLLERVTAVPNRRGDTPARLWSTAAVSVVATEGGRGDAKTLADRALVRLAREGIDTGSFYGRFLVVAGADHLGAAAVRGLAEHARVAGVRLVLMIDQPQGDLERLVGTGGAVCFMKMFNHKDAAVAAEFIGRGHKFVVSGVTRQVGASFTDGGGDSFNASTNQGHGANQRRVSGRPGRKRTLNDSRGHAWSNTRTWSSTDNVSTSTATSRVYEFVVEPAEILGMPETSFILVDNSTHGRRTVMADSNPGISLLPRVATTPAAP